MILVLENLRRFACLINIGYKAQVGLLSREAARTPCPKISLSLLCFT